MHLKLAVTFPEGTFLYFRRPKLAVMLAVSAICLTLINTGCATTTTKETLPTATSTIATAATKQNVMTLTEQPSPKKTPEPVPTYKPAPKFSAPNPNGVLLALDDILNANQYTVVLFYRGFF